MSSKEVVKEIKLTSEDKKIAKKIKSKLRKTAETIIEIGEELIKAIEEKPRGFKEVFYKEIGISDRSAQRYMQIANHVKVIELKENNELEGKTMTDLLQLITPDTSSKSCNSLAAPFRSSHAWHKKTSRRSGCSEAFFSITSRTGVSETT